MAISKSEKIVSIKLQNMLKRKFQILWQSFSQYFIGHDVVELEDNVDSNARYVFFLSFSDGKSRAHVVHAAARNYRTSWDECCKKAYQSMEYFNIIPKWIKADFVDWMEWKDYASLESLFKKNKINNFFRYGIALDKKFKIAFLEQECNANKIYDYTCNISNNNQASESNNNDISCINLNNLNRYIKKNTSSSDRGSFPINKIPEKVLLFKCQSKICDEKGIVYNLYEDGMSAGRREEAFVTKELALQVTSSITNFLIRQVDKNGSFIYGYYPCFDRIISSYNILRHSGTVWSMLCAYEIVPDDLKKKILRSANRAIKYLKNQLIFKDSDQCFVVDEKNNELKLGANGITILVLTKHMEIIKKENFTDLVRSLAEGILAFQQEDGHFIHVLDGKTFNLKSEFRTVYYDDEAAYALVKAYEITGDQKYLTAAGKAIDYFYAHDYVRYRDHWLSYALNAYTEHVPDEKYINFALENAWQNIDKIYETHTCCHIYLELLLQSYCVYQRCLKSKIKTKFFESIDGDQFKEVIRYRTWHMLDGYFYPEYAMYMKNPERILGSFFVRNDRFRSRIDDNQHFLDGFVSFYKMYEEICE